MTIAATPSEIAYAGDGSTVEFVIPFVFDTSADIKVILTDSDGTPEELSTGFAITGGDGSTGTLTMDTAPAVGETLTVLDDPELTQTADYTDNDSFPAETHEAALDRTVRQVKRLSGRMDRTLRMQDGDASAGDDLLLPITSTRAGMFLAFDADGNPTASSGTAGADDALRTDLATSSVGSQGTRLVAHRQSDSGAIARTIYVAMLERLSAKDFAIGDGVTDDTIALNDCFAAAAHRDVLIPAGTYKISGSLNRTNCNIEGAHKEFTTFDAGSGNFPIFLNPGGEFTHGCIKNLTFMYNDGIKPTNAGTQSLQAAIRFETVGGKSPNYDLIENCEMRGAWYAFYDDSGSYGSTLRGVFARACKNGFRKENGTTFTFDRCITGGDASSAGPDLAFYMNNNVSFSFIGCASDRGTPGAGNSVNDFRSCTDLFIGPWDAEGNTVSGADSRLFSFLDCDATIIGGTEVGGVYSENASFVSKYKADDSRLIFLSHRGRFNAGLTQKTMAGNGTFYDILAVTGSIVLVKGGSWKKPTIASGAPTLRSFHGTGTSRIQYEGVNTDATAGNSAHEIISDSTEQTQSLTGCTTVPTGTMIVRRNNQGIQLQFTGNITATSNTTAATLTPVLPAAFRPLRSQRVPCMVSDNGTYAMGVMVVGTDGSLTLNPSPNSATFTNAGTKGVSAQTLPAFSLD